MTSDDTIDDGSFGRTDPNRESLAKDGIDHEKAREGVRLLLESIGADPTSDPLVETWHRRVPSALETLTEGERESAKPAMRTFETDNDELVVKSGIPVYSLCEHHLLPYHGTAHVAYRPNGEAVGLSKLTRYVRWRSRRLTMQEQLTQEIATGLADELGSRAVLVEVTATHLCEAMRGIETPSETTTRATAGEPTRSEVERFQQTITDTGTETRR